MSGYSSDCILVKLRYTLFDYCVFFFQDYVLCFKRPILIDKAVELLHIVSISFVDRCSYTIILLVTFSVDGSDKSLDSIIDVYCPFLSPSLLPDKCRNRNGKFFLNGIHCLLNWCLDVEKRECKLLLVNSGKNSVFLHLVKSSFRLSLGFKNDFVLMPSSSFLFLGQFIVRDATSKTILAANLIVIVCM